jgi:hypothetical protein
VDLDDMGGELFEGHRYDPAAHGYQPSPEEYIEKLAHR